ncbi:MAG TPA: pseudouridine synthase [Anaerolineales bacterium]|nr:pseudouridine synthase [Anaerolineales bacterium]
MKERLQKILARAGLGSRRACEEWLRAGRVQVNGRVAALGESADVDVDRITVDGEPLRFRKEPTYVALHKPVGVVSTNRSQDGRPTVIDLVASARRLFPVGRLDADSEGLILLTDDGDLAQKLSHPRYGHEKEYRVQLDRSPDEAQLRAWRTGVVLDDGRRTAPAKVEREGGPKGAWVRVTIKEGRKRQIRRTAEGLGLRVVRLIRVRFGPLHLGNLRPGEWRTVPAEAFRELSRPGSRRRGDKPPRRAGTSLRRERVSRESP